MGRKSSKRASDKPSDDVIDMFCYYCDREFDDDNVLIEHQKARHFKCMCGKRMATAQSLSVHMIQVRHAAVMRARGGRWWR
jgi:hypothetical protein